EDAFASFLGKGTCMMNSTDHVDFEISCLSPKRTEIRTAAIIRRFSPPLVPGNERTLELRPECIEPAERGCTHNEPASPDSGIRWVYVCHAYRDDPLRNNLLVTEIC